MRGYSDRVNHALAFAAKHHDTQVRKGTRLPYITHPANVALILTRYGCDEDIVVGGILHDVIEDCVRTGYSAEDLQQRISSKFGSAVLQMVLAVTKRRVDDDGIELSRDDVKADYLERLALASEAARWVCAADKLHNASTTLADLRRTIEPSTVWNRFAGGRDGTLAWYGDVHARLTALGFAAPIMTELREVVSALQAAPVGDESPV